MPCIDAVSVPFWALVCSLHQPIESELSCKRNGQPAIDVRDLRLRTQDVRVSFVVSFDCEDQPPGDVCDPGPLAGWNSQHVLLICLLKLMTAWPPAPIYWS